MNVAFQVRRRPETEPASAALFIGRDPAPLLDLWQWFEAARVPFDAPLPDGAWPPGVCHG